jgi:hypothetical protein
VNCAIESREHQLLVARDGRGAEPARAIELPQIVAYDASLYMPLVSLVAP